MLKKLLILCFVIFITFFALFIYDNPTQKNVLTFSSWGSITEVEILQNVIKKYEEENPNIKIQFLHIPQNYFQKLHLLFASNQAPDVIFINNMYLPLYVSKLEDLSDWKNIKDFYPQSINAMTYNNKLYAIPRDVSNLVFYRNKSLIKKTPKDLNELLQIVSKSKKFGISYERNLYYMMPYILTFNENIYTPQKSLEYYKNLEGNYAPLPSEIGSSTLAQMFLNGDIGLYLSGRWLYPKIKEKAEFDWDIITFPGITPLDASGWAISKSSKHKKEAREFINYLSSKTTNEYFMQTGLIVPARIDVAQNIDNKVFLKAINQSKTINYDKDFRKKADKINKKLFE